MNDKRYAKLALILAVTSFVLSNSLLILPILHLFPQIFADYELPNKILGGLAFFCLPPGLVISVIAYKMGKRMNGGFLMINLTRILSLLAILASSFWIIMSILAPFISRFDPGW